MAGLDGNKHNLARGGTEAFAALLNAVAPETAEKPGKLSPDVVKRLAEKLSELVGEDVESIAQERNERGELLNDEGLPIVDITEPLQPDAPTPDTVETPVVVEEEVLLPLTVLPPDARDQLKQERDRILDMLEEEERMEEINAVKLEKEKSQEKLRKLKEAAEGDKTQRLAAREMQKKMGKALLRNMAEARESKESEERKLAEEQERLNLPKKIKKKRVSFVDPPSDDDSPARKLRQPGAEKQLKSISTSGELPMKATVVERTPLSPPPFVLRREADSDDESNPPTPPASDSDDDLAEKPSDELEDELDLDYAQHQREIALAYYEKRAQISEASTAAMMAHADGAGEEVKHTDGPIADVPRKPVISQFKANRIASAYNVSAAPPTSTSLGPSVVPASSAKTLQRAIRTGKLENDRLVGGDEGESTSDEELQEAQEILDLLKKGELYNIGPDGSYVHNSNPTSSSIPSPPSNTRGGPSTSTLGSGTNQSLPPPIRKPTKPSRFKLSRPQPQSSTAFPTTPSISTVLSTAASPGTTATTPNSNVFSMVVDSPSFPPSPPQQARAKPSATPPVDASSPASSSGAISPQTRQPPRVMSSDVREKNPTSSQQSTSPGAEADNTKPEKKISRFLAERL